MTTEAISKGQRCERLLEDPDLNQAFQDVRDALHRQIDELEPSRVDDLIKCKERLFLLDSVESNLRRAISDGHLEEFRLAEKQKSTFLGDVKWLRSKMQ